MSKKQVFINYVSKLFGEDHIQNGDIPDEAMDYWKALTDNKSPDKPLFTENGKIILKFLQEHQDVESWKAKDVAECLGISSRGVSGSMRKLVNDDFLEKLGSDPVFYALTQKGKEIKIEGE